MAVKRKEKPDRRQKMYIYCLSYMMKRAGATYHALAKTSGVDHRTIWKATQGYPLLLANGLALLEALKTRKFIKKVKINVAKELLP